jgi:hypothetical protein
MIQKNEKNFEKERSVTPVLPIKISTLTKKTKNLIQTKKVQKGQ